MPARPCASPMGENKVLSLWGFPLSGLLGPHPCPAESFFCGVPCAHPLRAWLWGEVFIGFPFSPIANPSWEIV